MLFVLFEKGLTVNYHDMCFTGSYESFHLKAIAFMSLLNKTMTRVSRNRPDIIQYAFHIVFQISNFPRSLSLSKWLMLVLFMSGWSVNQDESAWRWLSGSSLTPHNLSWTFFFSGPFFAILRTSYFFIKWFSGILEYSEVKLVKGSIMWSNILLITATVFKWIVTRKLFPIVQKRL